MSDPSPDPDRMKQRLESAALAALDRYGEGLNEEFGGKLIFDLTENDAFIAEVQEHEDHIEIILSTGTFQKIDALWHDAWQTTVLTDNSGARIADYAHPELHPGILAERSLTWLILHELMHIRLRHLESMGAGRLVETDIDDAGPPDHQNQDRKAFAALIQSALSDEEKPKLRPCLELQADSDATELLLGGYAKEAWPKLRINAACIFVVMALIEKANTAQKAKGITHPKAATRFFMMLAQLFQYWLYEDAHLEAGEGESWVRTAAPSNSEDFDAYEAAVLKPAINDAIDIATWADAQTFIKDLGTQSAIFEDISGAQYAENLSAFHPHTEGAKQWLELVSLNEKIIQVTGQRA